MYASATAGGEKRTSSEPWSAFAIRSTIRRARGSMPSGSANSPRVASMKASRRGSAPRASSTSAKKASNVAGDLASARRTSRHWTLPEPSQIEFSGISR